MAKRTGGYAVTIRTFIPTDPEDFDGQQKVIDAMKALKAGDATTVLAMAPKQHTKMTSKPETRLIEAAK